MAVASRFSLQFARHRQCTASTEHAFSPNLLSKCAFHQTKTNKQANTLALKGKGIAGHTRSMICAGALPLSLRSLRGSTESLRTHFESSNTPRPRECTWFRPDGCGHLVRVCLLGLLHALVSYSRSTVMLLPLRWHVVRLIKAVCHDGILTDVHTSPVGRLEKEAMTKVSKPKQMTRG